MSSKEEVLNSTNEPERKDRASDMMKEAPGKKGRATKEKLRSIMDAVSALTALGDEDGDEDEEGEGKKGEEKKLGRKEDKVEDAEFDSKKRFIPEHKRPDAALTFPEKMMNMIKYTDTKDPDEFCIAWLADEKSFVIRNHVDFTHNVLPQFFKATKFSSFIRKLYRWGFRQVNRGLGPDDPIIFGNKYFQRDDESLMAKMRSVTAAGTRRDQSIEESQGREIEASPRKRPMDAKMELQEQRKRIFLGQMIARQQNFGILRDPTTFTMNPNNFHQSSFNVASNLRPSMGVTQFQAFNGTDAMGAAGLSQNPVDVYAAPSAQYMTSQPYNSALTADIINAYFNVLGRVPPY